MADRQGQPLVLEETKNTHTALDPRARALTNAKAHNEELCQRRRITGITLRPTLIGSRPRQGHVPARSSKPLLRTLVAPRSTGGLVRILRL